VIFELIALSLAVIGLMSVLAPMFSLPSTFLRGTEAAGGIALFNGLGLPGGFVGPYIVGAIKEQTGAYGAAMMLLGGFLTLSAVVVLLLGRRLMKTGAAMEANT
jgi:ACS family tartrate transporter-like MFS transporter